MRETADRGPRAPWRRIRWPRGTRSRKREPAPVRIVYITQYFRTPDMSGSSRHYEWASRLAARGYDVEVVTGNEREPGGPRVTVEGGARVRWLGVSYDNGMSIRRRMIAFLEYAVRAAWCARRARADLVFASSTPLTVAIPALAAILGRPTPMVFEVRDLWPDVPIAMGGLRNPLLQRAARALEHAAYRNATRVVALSPEMRDGVVRAGFPATAVALVPNAADVDLFRRPGAEDEGDRFRKEHGWLGDRPLVLYAGALGRVNELSTMVDIAAATLRRDPDIRFLIVGGGAQWDEIAARARRLGVLDESLFMLPFRPKQEMPAIFAAASITTSFVADIPELAWNSANKVFDGFAAGRPVATNLGGSIGALLTGTGAGLVLSRDNDVAAGQLVDFLTDPDAVAHARAVSAALADEVFGRGVLFGVFEGAIAEACREGRVRRSLRPDAPVPREDSSDAHWWRAITPEEREPAWTSS
jgi:glycosyltransferase involved in cell wall biosynthesis